MVSGASFEGYKSWNSKHEEVQICLSDRELWRNNISTPNFLTKMSFHTSLQKTTVKHSSVVPMDIGRGNDAEGKF